MKKLNRTAILKPARLLPRLSAALGLISISLCCQPVKADIQTLPFYEQFPAAYTNGGTVINVNGTDWVGRAIKDTAAPQNAVWSVGNAGTGNQMVTGAAALSYPGLWQTVDSVCGLFMSAAHVTGNRNAGVQLATVNSGSVYTSFLVNVQSWPTNQNRMVCQLNSLPAALGGSDLVSFFVSTTNTTTGASNLVYVVKHSSNVSWTNVPASAPSITAGTTHLVVMRYTFNHTINPSANADELLMWLDPPSLGAAEANVPAPVISLPAGASGNDVTNFSSFWICAQNDTAIAGSAVFLDEIRIGRTWADVTPVSAPCYSVSLSANPTNVSLVEGGMAVFSVLASGTDVDYQWQVSTDGGTTWAPAPAPEGLTRSNSTFFIPSVTQALNNNRYRCQVSVVCNNSVSNSAAATLTVMAPVATAPGVLVTDQFMKRDRLSGPVNSTNTMWFTDIPGSLYAAADPDPFALVGLPQDGSCVWLGYFVDAGLPPVHLNVGSALKASLTFTCQGIASGTNSGIRLGLFDHYDSGIRMLSDNTNVKNTGARGYAFYQHWDTVFTDDEPQTVYVRNNLTDPALLSTTADYLTLAHSTAGWSNAPGFTDGTTYTIDLYVARMTSNACVATLSVTGGGTNYTTAASDFDYGYHRFDSVALRPNSRATTANQFEFSQFKVEVLQVPAAPVLNIGRSGENVVLTWGSSPAYAPFHLTQATTVGGTYNPVAGATSPYTVYPTNAARFFRLGLP